MITKWFYKQFLTTLKEIVIHIIQVEILQCMEYYNKLILL